MQVKGPGDLDQNFPQRKEYPRQLPGQLTDILPLHTVGSRDGPVVAQQSRAALVKEGGGPPLPQRHLPRPLPVLRLLTVHDLPLPGELTPELALSSDFPSAPGKLNLLFLKFRLSCPYLGLA